MSEEGTSEIQDQEFFTRFLRLKNYLESYRKDYVDFYSALEESTHFAEDSTRFVDDIDLAERVRGLMSTRLPDIRDQLEELRSQAQIAESLLSKALKLYLPKKANVPGPDDVSLTPAQRLFLNVKQRIEVLGVCIDEFILSVEECLEEASTQLIDQQTFDGAIEAAEELSLAIQKFGEDFPRLFQVEALPVKQGFRPPDEPLGLT